MFTVRKNVTSVLRHSTFFKGFLRLFSKNPALLAKQIKIGDIVLIDHNKVGTIVLVSQNSVGTVLLIGQYKIGDIDFVC